MRVKPKASQSGVKFWGENQLVVKVKAVPEKGRANERITFSFSRFFWLSNGSGANQIRASSKWKTVEIVGINSWKEGLGGGKK